jgi:hypothetical protein
MDDQGIETACRKGLFRAPHDYLQMRFVKLIEIGFAHIDSLHCQGESMRQTPQQL